MLILRSVPDTTDNQFWEHTADNQFWEHVSAGKSMNFVVWPANVGSKFVRVRVSTAALSEYDGENFGIDSAKTKAALERHRELIQQLARSKYRRGDSEVTLDVGDFPARS
jgi:hypothetical protein